MANNFPLILDQSSQKIKELPSGDNLDLTGNDIAAVRNILPETTGTYDLGSDSVEWRDLYLSGELNTGSLVASGLTFPNSDGSNGQVLSTDGAGTLSFIDAGGGGLEEDANGDITVTPSGGEFTIDGDLIVTGEATSLSDEREKENITTIIDALDIVNDLEGVYYNFKIAPENRSVGLIAQQTETVLPEVVRESNGRKTIAYGNIVGVLVQAIKELKAEVEELKESK